MAANTSPDAPHHDVVGNNDEYRPGGWNPRYVGILAVMVLAGEVGLLTALYPINAMPEIGAHFHTSQGVWIPSLYLLVAALASPMCGTLADRFGKKRLLVLILALAIVGLLVSNFASSFGILLAGRALQAPVLAFPFLLPSLARDIFPTTTIPMASSLAVTGAGFLGIPSQLLSGPIIEHLGWRSTFWIPAIYSAVVLILLFLVVPETKVRHQGGRIDVVGALLLGGGVALGLVGVSFGPTWGWTSPRVLMAFAGGVVLLAAWVIQAARGTDPLVDLRELGKAPILLTMLFAGIGMALSQWLLIVIPTVALTPTLLGGLGLDMTEQTRLAALNSLGSGLAGFLVGYFLRRRSGGTVAIAAMLLSTAGFAVAYLGLGSVPVFAVATLVISIGGAAGLGIAYYLSIRLVAKERQAVTASTLSLVFSLFSGIVAVVLFAVMNSLGTPDPASGMIVYGHDAFSSATLIPVALGVLAVLSAIVLRAKLAGQDIAPAQHEPAQAATPDGVTIGRMDQ